MDIEDPFENESGVTVRELIHQLSLQEDKDQYVCIGDHGQFSFYRVTDRGGCVQIEFNEVCGQDYTLTDRHPYSQYKAAKRRSSS